MCRRGWCSRTYNVISFGLRVPPEVAFEGRSWWVVAYLDFAVGEFAEGVVLTESQVASAVVGDQDDVVVAEGVDVGDAENCVGAVTVIFNDD